MIIKAGIVGGTGYTGFELIRLLLNHPNVDLNIVCSDSQYNVKISGYFYNLSNIGNLKFSKSSDKKLLECDVVFFATPHGTTMDMVKHLFDNNVKVIDLSADFRIKNKNVWEQWYNTKHSQEELLLQAVYGLPEINREKIKKSSLVANPGCYPTSVILGLLPIIKTMANNIGDIVCDCKSGVSGAGRKANVNTLFCEVSETTKAYSIKRHRHYPEIIQTINEISNIKNINLTFVPHLTPMTRGMLSTIYIDLKDNISEIDLQNLYEKTYKKEPFVIVLPTDNVAETRYIKASNHCHISVNKNPLSDKIVIISLIDNLVKGASGQALQNMNIMFGLNEKLGLEQIAISI